MTINPRSERFFLLVPIVMIGFIVAGFGAAIGAHPAGSRLPAPLILVHGVITLGWFVLTIVQALGASASWVSFATAFFT